ncbi:MAG: YebC/PmpR family DNA-binding transcriptional regulator [Candidatus Thioglobus sp.]|nr:MAG: YebC/PmpR family DNA-binding transcriptional regulator [Candidatus Thioglobus sp.]|tara:strand:- start:2298 stop:3044 length:747 start_codon:yes stop_codon:yes gene_type:complete
MAGHSKWANIQHRKKAQDAKRGKIFTKLIREITVAARMGGSDLSSNPRLRLAVDKGLGANMNKDTIDRAIKRGAGELEGMEYEEIRYEGYAPGGTAILVDCLTDNRNRTVSDVRHAFTKAGGNLGTSGSVAYMFNKQGVLSYQAGADEDRLMEVALESGADDIVNNEDGSVDVICSPELFLSVKQALEQASLSADLAEVAMRPSTLAAVDTKDAEKIIRLIDVLEELDDVQEVYSNADFPDEALENLS